MKIEEYDKYYVGQTKRNRHLSIQKTLGLIAKFIIKTFTQNINQ